MLPLNPILKNAFEEFEQDFLASNLPEGKYIKHPASTAKYYRVGQPCFEDKLQEQILQKSISLQRPLGPLWARFRYKFLRNLNTNLGRISTINFTGTFARTASSCKTVMEKCLHSAKATFKRVRNQILDLFRSFCHSPEPQTSTICVSSPRPKCLGHRCSEHKLVGSHCLCLPSHGSPSQGDPKSQAIQLPDHHNSPRLARDALVLGPSAALNRDPISTSSVKNFSQTVPQLCVP